MTPGSPLAIRRGASQLTVIPKTITWVRHCRRSTIVDAPPLLKMRDFKPTVPGTRHHVHREHRYWADKLICFPCAGINAAAYLAGSKVGAAPGCDRQPAHDDSHIVARSMRHVQGWHAPPTKCWAPC